MRTTTGIVVCGVGLAMWMAGCGAWSWPRETFEAAAVEKSIDRGDASVLVAKVPSGQITIRRSTVLVVPNGRRTTQASSASTVTITATVSAWARTHARAEELATQTAVQLQRDGQTITAECVPPDSLASGELVKAAMVVLVPAPQGSASAPATQPAEPVEIERGLGEVTLQDVAGPVTAHTGVGSIELTNVANGVIASTGTGEIVVQKVGGTLEATTGTGEITIADVRGSVHASTGTGEISLSDATGFWTGQTIELATGVGRISASISLWGLSDHGGYGDR